MENSCQSSQVGRLGEVEIFAEVSEERDNIPHRTDESPAVATVMRVGIHGANCYDQ